MNKILREMRWKSYRGVLSGTCGKEKKHFFKKIGLAV